MTPYRDRLDAGDYGTKKPKAASTSAPAPKAKTKKK